MTGEHADRARLLRLVVGPDGELVPDIEARLPGRGLWLTPRRDIVDRAVSKRLFARAARRPVTASAALADRIEALLARRCCDMLGLARRAALAIAGFDKVGEALRRNRVALLLFALDGAEGGRQRLGGHGIASAAVLYASELGMAFGRDRVVNVAVGKGPLGARMLLDLERLAGFREAAIVDRRVNSAPAGPARQDGGSGTHD